MRLLLVFLMTLLLCPMPMPWFETGGDVLGAAGAEILLHTFNDPGCSNPCWLGIEVGVTDKETALTILQERGIEFTLEGYNEDSIWLHSVPHDLLPTAAPEGLNRGGINIDTDNTVTLMSFELDLCTSTLVTVYGIPSVWHGILVYPDYQLFFTVNETTRRIDGVYLHMEDSIPPAEELANWTEYADAFSGDCSDVFTENED